MKCAIYIRVSTEEQAKKGYSLAAQTDKIVEFIKSKGWTYSEIYNDDGYSAVSRPDCVIINYLLKIFFCFSVEYAIISYLNKEALWHIDMAIGTRWHYFLRALKSI